MSDHKRRVNRLEEEADSKAPEKPALFLFQGKDENHFSGRDLGQGKQYHRSEFDELAKHYRLILFVESHDYLGDGNQDPELGDEDEQP